MNKKPLLAGSLLLLLASCTVGPDYEAPEVNPPDKFFSGDVLKHLKLENNEQTLAIDWWTGFQDERLNQLVSRGLEDNHQVAAAFARVKASEARIKLAKAGDNFRADGVFDASVSSRDINNTKTDETGIAATLDLSLPVDLFGKTRREAEFAMAQLEESRYALKGLILDTSADIVAEYLALRGQQQQLILLKEFVILQEKTLSIVKTRFESGLAPELDLRRAETAVANLRADIPQLEESLLKTRNRLASLTGQYAGAYESDLGAFDVIPAYQVQIPQTVPLDVVKSRPDVLQAESRLKMAIANIGIARSLYYPSFSLSGQVTIGNNKVSGSSATDILIGSISALIDYAFTDGGERSARVKIARAEAEQSLAEYRHTLLIAIEDVENALASIESSLQRQQALEKALAASQKSFEQTNTLYQQGLISFLDVVDAQRVLANTEQDLARERTRYATLIARLFQVLGHQQVN